MIPKNTLKICILEYQQFVQKVELVKRKLTITQASNYVFTGCRRAGKSYLMFQLIQQLLAEGTPLEQILYINFEDERLLEMTTADLSQIIPVHQELFEGKPVLFLDEIQNVEGWEKYVRRLADMKYLVYVSGSNAKMLSRDISTTLGGRFFVKEVYPLNFKEYLTFKDISFQEKDIFSPDSILIKRAFNQYLISGGFPESLNFANTREYVSNIFKKVLYSDIMARHSIRSEYSFELLIKKLAETLGDETSNKRMRNLLTAAGSQINPQTLTAYLQYCRDAYLIFKLNNHLAKFAERETRKKYYFIDNGLLSLFYIDGKSQLLENLIFKQLQFNNQEEIFYLRSNWEIDFYIPSSETAIQVAYGFQHPETKKRELKSIAKLKTQVPIKEAFIITFDDEESTEINGLKVRVVPAWKWILGF